MSQISKHKIDNGIYTEIFETIIGVIVKINSTVKAKLFFNSFFSPTEKLMFAKRLAIGLLLSQGLKYRDISMLLKVSLATVGAVSFKYNYDENYRKIINDISKLKLIKNIFIKSAEKLTGAIAFGGKGSYFWKELNKNLKTKKSSLYQ